MPEKNQASQQGKKPMDPKKLLMITAVTVLVIIAAILVDSAIRYPRCEDETAALNVVIQKVLPSVDEIAEDEGFSLTVQEIDNIGDSDYYPILITRIPKCEDGEGAKHVVETRVIPSTSFGGQVDLNLLDGVSFNEEPYFVVEASRTADGKKEVLETYYVRAKNSQPYTFKDENTLTPAAEEEELSVLTVYIRIKDSQVFLRDETTGQLVPYGG